MTGHKCRPPAQYGHVINRTKDNPNGHTWTCASCKQCFRATMTGWIKWDPRKHKAI